MPSTVDTSFPATPPGRVARVVVLLALIAEPGSAWAQTTLVVRADTSPHDAVASAVDEALRESVGGSARRVEPTLEELALAAGCLSGDEEPECIAAIAEAGSARLVAIEHVSTSPTGVTVRVDLRRGRDGSRLRSLVVVCPAGECGDALLVAMGRPAGEPALVTVGNETSVALVSPVERSGSGSPAAGATRSTTTPSTEARVEHGTGGPPLARTLLFGGAALASVGATIAGALAVDYAAQATRLGRVDTRREADQLVERESSRDVSLAVATVFASVGAGLAIGALVTPGSEHTVRIDATPVAGIGALVSVRGAF